MRRNEVERHQKALADLHKKLADETKREAAKASDASRIEGSIGRTTSPATMRSKQQQISRLMNEIAAIQAKKADIGKKIADASGKLHRAQDALAKEEANERKKLSDADKKREREQLIHERAITQELRSQYAYRENSNNFTTPPTSAVKYDVFVSHASEDKEEFVKPLVTALTAAGFKVWYDEFTLKVGDSLRRSIDSGLKNSRYGIVVLSNAFFSKNWTQYELDGLVTREMNGHKVILPIWHLVTKNQVQNYSPTLADKKAINSSISTIEEIVSQLAEVLEE